MTKRRKFLTWFGLLLSLPAGVSFIFYAWFNSAEPERWPLERAGLWAGGATILALMFFALFVYSLVSLVRVANRRIVAGVLLAVSLAIPISYLHLRASSPLFNLFFSPADLYNDLSEDEFDLSSQGYSREMAFNVKYPGNHWIAILADKPVNDLGEYDSDFKVKVTIKDNSKVISEAVVSDTSLWFSGGPERSGFALKTYSAPVDLPIGRPLFARVEVVGPSYIFTKKYGKQRIVIGKFSDE